MSQQTASQRSDIVALRNTSAAGSELPGSLSTQDEQDLKQ